jgi:hypothetical protein
MPGVAGDQPSNVMSPIPGADEAYDVKQGLKVKLKPAPQVASVPGEQVSSPAPIPSLASSQGPTEADLAAIDAKYGVAKQGPSEAELAAIDAKHGIATTGAPSIPEQTNFGGGAARQEFLSRAEANPMVQNLKYPAAAVGGMLGGIPGAGVGGAIGESIGQASRAAQGENITPLSAAGHIAGAGAETAAQEFAGTKVLGPALESVGALTGKAFHALQSMPWVGKITNMSKQAIQTLGERASAVADLVTQSEGSVSKAADMLRENYNAVIGNTKQQLNGQITDALKDNTAMIDVDGTIQGLKNFRDRLKPDIHNQDINHINGIIKTLEGRKAYNSPYQAVGSVASADKISIQDANEIKKYLQGMASDAYQKPGEIFTTGSGADNAVKAAASDLRMKIDKAAPAVGKANETLSELHNIDDTINGSILKEGKPDTVLLNAGNRKDERTVQMLLRLGKITGTNMQEQAENLAAMKTFAKPGLSNLESAPPIGNRIVGSLVQNRPLQQVQKLTAPLGRVLQQPGLAPALVGATKAVRKK